jgi:hypothetical protein
MKFIQGQDRFQTSLFPVSLDASIDDNNEVRLIDAFVENLLHYLKSCLRLIFILNAPIIIPSITSGNPKAIKKVQSKSL